MNSREIGIAPSILSADFGSLIAEIKQVEDLVKYLHIDVMDGHYVPNISVGIPVIKSIRKQTDLLFDVHLMIENPDQFINVFAEAGADLITFHIECSPDPVATINNIKSIGKKAGISIHPDTPIDVLLPVLPYVDLVLIMSVRPGFGGQNFINESLMRIKVIRDELEKIDSKAILSVDGGINLNTIKKVYEAGANLFVVGNACFATPNPANAVKELLSCVIL